MSDQNSFYGLNFITDIVFTSYVDINLLLSVFMLLANLILNTKSSHSSDEKLKDVYLWWELTKQLMDETMKWKDLRPIFH